MTQKTEYLLDASVVIALCSPDHASHQVCLHWLTGLGTGIALCPISEGAFLRGFVRTSGQSIADGQTILSQFLTATQAKFYPNDLSYTKADFSRVFGHRQVTDAYLVSLAKSHNLTLVTLDRPLAALYPNSTKCLI